MSPSSTSSTSRYEVKEFLNTVKEKIPGKEFKEFIKLIKLLTDRNNIQNKTEIFNLVKILFGERYKDLYDKFEKILSNKKN
jgi:hypothetical protein